jgi:uncharacterized protein (TIGR00255 family)
MIKSMTAYGRAKYASDEYDATVEVRSVNSRYFDCSVRIPRAYAYLEEKIKAYLQTHVIARGKVDVSITYERHGGGVNAIRVNEEYATAYLHALAQLRDQFSLTDDISVMKVAANADVFTCEREDEDPADVWARLEKVLGEAGESFSRMRATEGEKIERDIKEKLSHVAAWADEVEEISRRDTVGYRDKLESRLRAILSDHEVAVDENRLLTECAIWADKIAIDEELTRLRAHFGAFHDICAESAPSGKKLDFLMQELNRETNTIGSKANNAQIARLVVNMKNELEKIREQVQNIE